MNIIVNPHGKELCYCRPDTTGEKDGRDLYVPEGVDKILWAPVIYAKVCKAGKCVSPKFVTRYYDTVGFGALIYGDDENIAFSSCMDHSSLMPVPSLNPNVFETENGSFTVSDLNFITKPDMQAALEKAVCRSSERISLRIGDIVAVELTELQVLAERSEGEKALKAEFDGECLFDVKVIF